MVGIYGRNPKYPFQSVFFAILLGFIQILPYFLYRPLSFFVIAVMGLFMRRLHKNALESLGIAFSDTLPIKEKRRIAQRSFFVLAEGIASLIYGIMHPEFTKTAFVVEGGEHLDQALARGKGAVVAIGHYGAFAWMVQYWAYMKPSVSVVMKPPRSKFFREKFLVAKAQFGLALIYSTPVRECVVECYRCLKEGGIVFMPIDQNYGGNGRVFVDFFGRKAATAPGAAGYALKAGAALFFAFCYKGQDGREHIVVQPEISLAGAGDDQDSMFRITQQLTARLEGLIRERPEQWSWMHRRWKAVPRENELEAQDTRFKG